MLSILKKILISILNLESRLVLRKYKPFIIAVTGSVGKTSTKDAIYEILKYPKECLHRNPHTVPFIRKSEKSFNSEIGVPLTILGVANAWKNPIGWLSNVMYGLELLFTKNEYPNILVLEVGADHPGDIEHLTKWLKPDIAVITKVGDVPVHVEFFGSPQAVLREKLFLAQGVKKGGTVILYADDRKLRDLKFEGRDVTTYGTVEGADVRGSAPAILYKDGRPSGISFKLEYKGASATLTLFGVLGVQHVYPILAATSVGLVQGVTLAHAIQGLISNFKPPRGRMNIIDGLNGSTIIDDSYNSSPTALEVALGALAEVKGAKRKIAVLGDMMELGSYSDDEHQKAGRLAAKSLDPARGDLLVTVGQRAKGIGNSALEAGMKDSSVIFFDDSVTAADKVKTMIKAGDVILVKGSQSPRMERIVKAIMADPSRAPDLLVRQEKEWLER